MLDEMSNLLAPPAPREGDTIAVVAPAGPVPLDRLGPGLRHLEKHYKLLVSPDIDRRDAFLAGSDARRTEEFNDALRSPDVRAIWAARGGYGCSRIVDDLDAAAMRADPVPIVGFSDVTVLLCWAAKLGIRSIHGPVLTQLGELDPGDVQWVLEMLAGKSAGAELPCSGVFDVREGLLVGGNMSLLAHLCGTAWAPAMGDAICILEDVGERPYALDRYATQLLAQEDGKVLSEAAAVLLGDFDRCQEASDRNLNAIEMLRARLSSEGIACGSGLPVGHGGQNRAFPFGARARIGPDGLKLLEPATAA